MRCLFPELVGRKMTAACKIQNARRKEEEFVQNESNFRLAFLSFIIMTPALTVGMVAPFSAIALPQMKLTLDESSWFGSIVSIASLFGSLFIGSIMDRYGRRFSMIASILPNIVGWFLLAEKTASVAQLYLARALTGFAQGAAMLPFVVYAAECVTVNNVRIRGLVGTLLIFSMVTGGLLLYALSVVLPYNEVALASAWLSVLSLALIVIFIPESPAWLYRRGREGDAEIAQLRLGIKQPILQRQSGDILPTQLEVNETYSSLEDTMRYLSQVKKPDVYKPLITSIVFLFFCEFSGLYCLLGYMIDVITVYPQELSPYVLSFVGQLLQIVGCVLLSLTLPHSGVKILSIASFVGASIGFVVLAFSISFESASSPNIFNRFHVMSIWATMLCGQLGVFCIPYTMLGEIFPMGAKGYASVSLSMDCLFNFIVMKYFLYVYARYKTVVFFVFGGICACGAAFVAFCLPETVGKTTAEIERGFNEDGGDEV